MRLVAFIAVVPGVAGAFDEAFDAVGTGSRMGLRFVDDVVDAIIFHVEAVAVVAVALGVAAGGLGEAVEAVVVVVLGALAADVVEGADVVAAAEDVADFVEAVGEVLEGALFAGALQVFEVAVFGVVVVGGFDAVAEFDVFALFEFVVLEGVDVGLLRSALFAGDAVDLAAYIVVVDEFVAVGVGELLHAAPAVVVVAGDEDFGGEVL